MTTTRVADVAGVSIGSLYQYFPTKEALVGALVDEHIEEILGVLARAAQDEDQPLEVAVRGFVRTVLAIHAVDPELHVALTMNLSGIEGFEKLIALTRSAREVVSGYLDRFKRQVRPRNLELASFILVHSVQAVVSAAVVDRTVALRGPDDPELCDELTHLVLGYLERR
jgi:AcrR family transcriptional regulator